ncbi:hypothetical protein BKA69DRAFT_1076577 [Paraphysoderma sedebokerense]|nr:hypothetical protein BKA69DRAFT_1076577 [Paraphysoderma sedebokerense]
MSLQPAPLQSEPIDLHLPNMPIESPSTTQQPSQQEPSSSVHPPRRGSAQPRIQYLESSVNGGTSNLSATVNNGAPVVNPTALVPVQQPTRESTETTLGMPNQRRQTKSPPGSRRPSSFSAEATSFRTICVNDRPKNEHSKFLHNGISTAKYTYVTFLPKFFFEQFSKYANLFFLFTACIQQIPDVSPTNQFDTIIPLSLVLAFTGLKEGLEDSRRHKNDDEVNNRPASVLVGDELHTIKWRDVKVGDIVRVENGKFFPADLLLISSSEPEGICFIETSSLDGETNLKIKQARPETAKFDTLKALHSLSGVLETEQPNNSLYTFEGTFKMSPTESNPSPAPIPLEPKQILLRGAQLRNTTWVYGIVIFTGHESKLMRNATAAPIKTTDVERTTNKQILVLVCILFVLALSCAIGTTVLEVQSEKTLWYLSFPGATATIEIGDRVLATVKNLLTFWILFNNLIPISLIVTMEMVKYIVAGLISADEEMFYDVSQTPAVVRTSSLVEELGQVGFIFSDKTGTLTCNIMEWKECCVGGIMYAEEVLEEVVKSPETVLKDNGDYSVMYGNFRVTFRTYERMNQEVANIVKRHGYGNMNSPETCLVEFLTLLATCHTVIPENNEDGSITYQASSPDEAALVKGAKDAKFVFVSRKPTSITINVPSPDNPSIEIPQTYELLAVNEFNSTRKRMSLLLRRPNGKIVLYLKGADSVIIPRLDSSHPWNSALSNTELALQYYATEGLRTLSVAMKEVPEEEYNSWKEIYDRASTTLVNRGEELDKAAELIEQNMVLLGCTAIEDKLQDGVPDTIYELQRANIKIWVLTGDRQETAINIGYSCKLLQEDMELLIVNTTSKSETKRIIDDHIVTVSKASNSDNPPRFALIIDGASLTHALSPTIEDSFYKLGTSCIAVIACRVSPLQKSLIVKLVKNRQTTPPNSSASSSKCLPSNSPTRQITLAIGDGANDVSMIQAAHVGVGISGMEGLQAARSADIAIAQFRYLKRLLLVHGCWSYHRLVKLILYSFYKNITLYMTQFWFALFNGFSGQTIYESWVLSSFNVFFTSVPPLVIGIFDKVLLEKYLESVPELYTMSQSGKLFSVKVFWSWLFNALVHSIILFFSVKFAYGTDVTESDGINSSIWNMGVVLYTSVLATVIFKAMLITNFWAFPWSFIGHIGSLIFWLIFLPAYGYLSFQLDVADQLVGIIRIYTDFRFYLVVVVVATFTLMRDYSWQFYKYRFRPTKIHIFQGIAKEESRQSRHSPSSTHPQPQPPNQSQHIQMQQIEKGIPLTVTTAPSDPTTVKNDNLEPTSPGAHSRNSLHVTDRPKSPPFSQSSLSRSSSRLTESSRMSSFAFSQSPGNKHIAEIYDSDKVKSDGM